MPTASSLVRRVSNGLRKIASGRRPFGESVWPGVPNDLFVAHSSIYHFAGRFVRGARVLDAGCGTGYGAPILVSSGAIRVHGVDIDARSIAYARRHFTSEAVSFSPGDCQDLALEGSSLDFVFASNVLEHLDHPELFLHSALQALRPGGRALFALPPITSEATAALHGDIAYHRSNLTLRAWHDLISGLPWTVAVYRHSFEGPGKAPDFASPRPSALTPSAFAFTESTVESLYASSPITAVFLAAWPAA